MKQTGICPKCGGDEIAKTFRGGFGGIPMPDRRLLDGTARTDVFICEACGYVEEYVTDVDRLEIKSRRRKRSQ